MNAKIIAGLIAVLAILTGLLFLSVFMFVRGGPLGKCVPGAKPAIVLARCADVQP